MRKRLLIGLAGFVAALGGLGAAEPGLVLINESPSLPTGIYLRTRRAPAAVGDVVAVEPPPVARTYLSGLGVPPEVRLLKRVVAGEGARACAVNGVVVAGRRRLRVRSHDRLGRALPQWTDCRTLHSGEVFLAGDTPGSFDSRYFGPVPASQVTAAYQKVLSW